MLDQHPVAHHVGHIMLAVFAGTAPWLVGFVDNYGFIMTHFVVPTLSATVLGLQLWLIWKKRKRH